MRVLVLTFGDNTVASSRTRIFQYTPYLKEYGITFNIIVCFKKSDSIFFLNKYLRLLYFLFLSLFYKTVVIQKVLIPPIMVNILRKFHKKIIYDFDDAMYTTQDDLKADKSEYYFKHIVSNCDLVILENENAKNYVSSLCQNILLITGPIETERYCNSKEKQKNLNTITLGWIGSPSTTLYLEQMADVFDFLTLKYPNLTVKIIGADLGILSFREASWLKISDWDLDTEVEELMEFDIGIMPLQNNEWAKGKGGYKLLQYMSIGIPSVASPVGINCDLIRDGVNGYLALTNDEWKQKLSMLIESEALRIDMGGNSRKIAVDEYSFYQARVKLADAFLNLNK
jgi:glycosyltransferase involved in cell wall biosynthesis